MRIPLFYNPITKSKKYVCVELKYKAKQMMISIGSDCHPAYILKKFNLRERSLPFDWLNTKAYKSLVFVNSNLEDDFSHFLLNFYKNERGYVVSEKYNYSEFMHEPTIIDSAATRQKFQGRIYLFLNYFKSKNIMFLFNIPSDTFSNEAEIDIFIESLNHFLNKMKKKDSLHMYMRYDESLNENLDLNQLFFSKIPEDNRLHFAKSIRYKNQYGVWGNTNDYKKILTDLNVNIRLTFPKIFFI